MRAVLTTQYKAFRHSTKKHAVVVVNRTKYVFIDPRPEPTSVLVIYTINELPDTLQRWKALCA